MKTKNPYAEISDYCHRGEIGFNVKVYNSFPVKDKLKTLHYEYMPGAPGHPAYWEKEIRLPVVDRWASEANEKLLVKLGIMIKEELVELNSILDRIIVEKKKWYLKMLPFKFCLDCGRVNPIGENSDCFHKEIIG